jgi:hypothetical protein
MISKIDRGKGNGKKKILLLSLKPVQGSKIGAGLY